MHTLLSPLFIILLYVLVHSADSAITAGIARDVPRVLAYGIVAVLAVIAVVLALV